MPRPKDVVCATPRILFVGINPGARSGQVGRHFAGKGNPFWRLLHDARLTPVLLTADEDQRLADFGYALTNLCPRPTRTAAELDRAEMERGTRRLLATIARLEPAVVALVGVTLYNALFPKHARGGAGAKPETIAGARVFVVPNPSGLNAAYPGHRDKLIWFEKLARFSAASGPGTRPPRPTPPRRPPRRTSRPTGSRTRARRRSGGPSR